MTALEGTAASRRDADHRLPPSPHGAALGLNARAWSIADSMVGPRRRAAGAHCSYSPNGARVIDAGIDVRGGYGAGSPWPRSAWADLATSRTRPVQIGDQSFAGVDVWTDHPAVSCMASQYAGWAIKTGEFFGMGSGPLRAHARVEKELFAKLRYAEAAAHGVLVLETRAHRPRTWRRGWPSGRTSTPAQLTLVVAPTASIAGCVQIVARMLETGLHKMDTLGFDVTRVVSGVGTAPFRRSPQE